MRRSKFVYLGFPFILLVLYLVWVPSPSVKRIYIQDDLGYIAEGFEFTILKLTPRDQIKRLSSTNLAYTVKDLAVTGGFAYLITSDGKIHIIDIRNPSSPKRLIQFSTPGIPKSIAADGSTIYIADYEDGIRILNIADPSKPSEKGAILNVDDSLDVDVIGSLVYVARGNQELDVYDISNPAEPRQLGQYQAGGNIEQMTIQKTTTPEGQELTRGILVIEKSAVQVVDFTNAQQPTLVNSFDFDGVEIEQALIVDKKLFIVQRKEGLVISNIKENGKLEPLADINTSHNTFSVALIDSTVYFATGFEGLQVFDITKLDNIYPVGIGYSRFWDHKIWIGLLTIVFLVIWLAFFAQFVLPVRTIKQRQKIFDRLIIFLLGKHGPAISIENGHRIERAGESDKKGPGVVWLDTASAAVVRTATKFREAIGPGVYFTSKAESLTGPVDLHTQVDSLGPFEQDNPFEKKTENQSIEAYREIQNRRKLTSALTRDGIEVVPTIRLPSSVAVQDTRRRGNDRQNSSYRYRRPARVLPAIRTRSRSNSGSTPYGRGTPNTGLR